MKKLTITALLLFIFLSSFPQKNFFPGWIQMSKGDTLHGYLQQEIRKDIIETINFKAEGESSDFKRFTVAEVQSFKYDEGNLYRTITFTNSASENAVDQTCFARQLVAGIYSLFEIIKSERTFYIIRNENTDYFLYSSIFGVSGALEKEGNYLNQLIQLATTCNGPNLHPERVDYTNKDLLRFVLELNNCNSPGSTSINYYHKTKTVARLFVFAGGLPLGNRSQLTADLMGRFVYPQIDPRLSFNIGLHYSNTEKPVLRRDYTYTPLYTQTNYKITSIPIFVQYNFTRGIIQPYIYGGASAAYLAVNPDNPWDPYDGNEIYGNNQFNIELLGGIGVEAYITPWFLARIDWRYEYTLQFPSIGLGFKF
jgi:hypothetical protein